MQAEIVCSRADFGKRGYTFHGLARYCTHEVLVTISAESVAQVSCEGLEMDSGWPVQVCCKNGASVVLWLPSAQEARELAARIASDVSA